MNDWENICLRCGLCCFEKIQGPCGRWHISQVPCRHLDIIERRCRVYHKRLTVGEGCVQLTPETVEAADWLPETCAYRTYLEFAKR
jgi:uncharacterized cysteine cluster protein YcgN (CxxCxxCC family)